MNARVVRRAARARVVGFALSLAAAACCVLSCRSDSGTGPDAAAERPNVVLVVIDTLRADHVGAYGYARDTTPRIDALFAARGTLFERAYAQAPWTLPSAASYLTGRHPGELQRSRSAGVVIPDDVPTLAERLRAGGYRTAAFVANPTLFPAAGFDRGFDTWWLPPARVESLARPAGDVVERAAPWLEAHAGGEEPFFLYLHFIDPHDPYSSPDTGGERSPFLPDYGGRLTGHDVHALYLGQQALAEGEAEAAADRAQITALYDSEIAWVDRALGELVDRLPPEVVRETLWIVTSDHGEELHERGGWKHGHTLYDEQVRVPLLVRWDGEVAAGRRVGGGVRLLDLVPTVLAAASVETPGELPGLDLLPVLRGGALPLRPAAAQRLSFGPVLAGVVSEGWKLVLYNAREPYEPADALQRATFALDHRRLERVALFDLVRDPAEVRNLAAERPDKLAELAPLVLGQLGRELPGLRVSAGAGLAGRILRAELTLAGEPEGWWPELLAAGDRVELRDGRLHLEWQGEPLAKGVRLIGASGGISSVAVWLDGEPVEPWMVVAGEGLVWDSLPLAEQTLLADHPPDACGAGEAVLCLWQPRAPARAEDEITPELDRETRERLEALGYLGEGEAGSDGR
jgi:arylsulfatase A-like enzyme